MAINIDDTTKRKALKILEDEQTQLDGAYDKQAIKGSRGMESDFIPETAELAKRNEKRITKDSKGRYSEREVTVGEKYYDEAVVDEKETQFKEDAETLQEVCKAYDNEIIRLNNEIDAKKLEIVNLNSDAVTGVCSMTSVAIGTSKLLTFNEEVEFVKIYTKMAGPGYDPGTDNPFEPDATVHLNGSYAGFGYQNVRENKEILVGSGAGTTTGIHTDGSGPLIGSASLVDSAEGLHTLNGASDASNCVAIGNSISAAYSEIITLRKERDSYRNKLNIIKKNKSDKELSHWGYQNTKNEVNVRKNKNASVISAIKELDGADTVQEPGLVYYLDAANNSSYYGSGNSWYDISESGEDADNEAELYGFSVPPPVENSLEFFEDPFDTFRSHFKFNKNNSSSEGYLNFQVSKNLIDYDSTLIVTVEMLSQLTLPEVSTANNGGGEIIFGWNKYSIWTGKNSTGTEPIHLGFSSDIHTQRDLYGLTSEQVNNLGLVNTDPLNERIHNVDPANWAHYVFVFNKGDYTKNKIYINGVSQTLQQITDSAVVDNNSPITNNLNFNVGANFAKGAVASSDPVPSTHYRTSMELALMRIYNKELTQAEITANYDQVKGRFNLV